MNALTVYSAPMVDRAYAPGPCSRLSDVIGPPIIGPIPTGVLLRNVCGKPSNGQRRIILEFDFFLFIDYIDSCGTEVKNVMIIVRILF